MPFRDLRQFTMGMKPCPDRPKAQIANGQMKMAAGWHFSVKVCKCAPLELE